jgi:hypothetical protein
MRKKTLNFNALFHEYSHIAALTFILTCSLIINVGLSAAYLDINVTTEKGIYLIRENVIAYGNVTFNNQPVNEGLVAIQIDDPLSGTVIARTVPAVNIPSISWDIEIIEVYPCDSAGRPKSIIQRGAEEWFKATVKNKGAATKPVCLTINLYDNDSIPIAISIDSTPTLLPGQTFTSMPRFKIPEWATIGNATAYAAVWTDWPKNGGYPQSPEKSITFQIIASGEDGITPSPPPSSISDQSYQAFFRLSPEALPGTYKIYVSAWYQGWIASSFNTFLVQWMPTPPRASFTYWPPKAGPNITIRFDASSSTAEGHNDTITSYQWDFGDGNKTTGKVVYKTYSQLGQYLVTLNVTDAEGFWNTTSKIIKIEEIHDLSITSIICLNEVYSDWLVEVTVTVLNKGTMPENFNVSIYYDDTLIGKQAVTELAPFDQMVVLIGWNTAGVAYARNYTLWANVTVVPNEVNVTDNQLIFGDVRVKMLGDVIYDRIIDIFDVVAVTSIYDLKKGDPQWNPQADLAPDGVIDIFDVVITTSRYETTY